MDRPVIVFDGVCNLCNAFVQFVIARDPRGVFRFAPLQSNAARSLLAGRVPDQQALATFVLVDGDAIHTRSTAALQVARRLGFPWTIAFAFLVIPRFLRDAAYSWIARNRYRWFGKRESCMVPSPERRGRFLSD